MWILKSYQLGNRKTCLEPAKGRAGNLKVRACGLESEMPYISNPVASLRGGMSARMRPRRQ
jgi:hypothetical protein